MYKALCWLAIFITVCVLPVSTSAADHSAELFLQLGHSDSVTAVVFSPDGTTLASGSDDTTIKLWDVLTRQSLATLDDHSDSVSTVAFSPDGQTLASGSADRTLKLWDVARQKLLATLNGHSSSVNAIAFTPDGKTLASGVRLENIIERFDDPTK
jgi:WD40 repeat protein